MCIKTKKVEKKMFNIHLKISDYSQYFGFSLCICTGSHEDDGIGHLHVLVLVVHQMSHLPCHCLAHLRGNLQHQNWG